MYLGSSGGRRTKRKGKKTSWNVKKETGRVANRKKIQFDPLNFDKKANFLPSK